METSQKPVSDMLEIMDRILTAALKEVRRARQLIPPEERAQVQKMENYDRKSVPSECEDILNEFDEPMHILKILEELDKRGVKSNRESLVSALTKRRHPNGPFVRTAPNTFGLAKKEIK